MHDSDRLQTLLKRLAFLGLAALAVTVFLGKPQDTSLQALDSTTHAEIALEVSKGGLLPVLPMVDRGIHPSAEERFNDHPFPLFYLSGKVMRLLGPSAFSARLIPCLFSAGTVLLLAWLGSLLYSPAAGLVAGLILMLSRDYILIGSRFHLDTPMVFFILLSFILWKKKHPLLAGAAAGLGLWMKTPVTFLLFPSAFFALLVTRRLDRKSFLTLVQSGIVALGVGFSVWILTGMIGGWDLVLDYWKRQVWGTAVGGRSAVASTDYFMGIARLQHFYLPWMALLLVSLVGIFWKKRWRLPQVALTLSAALILEGVISGVRFKFFWYFIPIYPFLALLCVDSIANFLERKKIMVYTSFVGLGVFIPVFLLATPIPLGPENFPALRKFEPFIQAYGSSSDQILFIEGEQPYGGKLDSIYELTFYTGRRVLQGTCESAEDQIKTQNPEWIVVSGANFKLCLKESTRSKYPAQYRYGRQYLLSRIIPKEAETDLTPLRRELRAPLDGSPSPLPTDSYFLEGP
jgi:4-amino-4-deoxy-L-arabinose transferase-like glycosyltransferase